MSIQGAPASDTDGESIWCAAQMGRAIGPNAVPKIPATLPGFVAFERVVESGWPVIVTEVFSLDQLEAACGRYEAVTARVGVRPPFFAAPDNGHFRRPPEEAGASGGFGCEPARLELAGVYVARRCAALVAGPRLPCQVALRRGQDYGGSTGLVGDRHSATINWSTFSEVISQDPRLERTIDQAPDAAIAERLLATFPDVWKAWELGRVAPEEFEQFPPVVYFRDSFITGWRALEVEVGAQRLLMAKGCRGLGVV